MALLTVMKDASILGGWYFYRRDGWCVCPWLIAPLCPR